MSSEPVKDICLDAFGTLCQIQKPRHPYPTLFELIGVNPGAAARLAMTMDLPIDELARRLVPEKAVDLTFVREALDEELTSVALFEDVSDTLDRLRRMGHRLWVASNLAAPYAKPLRVMLDQMIDGYFLSFEMGSIKPEPEFFQRVCARLATSPVKVVMVGNSQRADVDGARAAGMRAVLLNRGKLPRNGAIGSLRELVAQAQNGWN
jgi:HAD superfamily hydrolase (TIGR01509 family)